MKKKNIKTVLPSANALLTWLGEEKKPCHTAAIADHFQVPQGSRKELEKLLKGLAGKNEIKRLSASFWSIPDFGIIMEGEYLATPSGGGRVRITDPVTKAQKDVRISGHNASNAWHKDIVRILLQRGSGKGRILEVISRQNKLVPGILAERAKSALIFRSTDGRNPHLFSVPKASAAKLDISADTVVLLEPIGRITSKSKKDELWESAIIKVIGPLAAEATQEAIVKISQQVPQKFPDLALAQAAALPPMPLQDDLTGREDLRHLPFVTIDGADAKDFDDAIQVEKVGDDYILRVAIADVSHYVTPDERRDSLDGEARARGNSWYFPRSVEPMLPKNLSNGLCSLKPHEDRLAMLAEMRLNKQGDVLSTHFAPIVMNSRARLVYDQVAKYFAGERDAISDQEVAQMLDNAFQLYTLLYQKRRQRGTLDFILPEPAYAFDENGRLLSMREAERNDAHLLIEEFMIAANEAVAEYLSRNGWQFLHRIHPQPEKEKLAQLYHILSLTAPELLPAHARRDRQVLGEDLQDILNRAKGTPQEYLVNRLCLRSMGQARYQPENIGHFGLASQAYCHFTSPIRRYADLTVHRTLKDALENDKKNAANPEQLAALGNQLNGLERKAIDCEREIARRLACIALEDKAGHDFKGTVSAITDFGLFMEFADLPTEGLIPIEALGDDWFEVDNATQTIMAAHSRARWSLGQPIVAKLISINLERQEIRLAPVIPPAVARHRKIFRRPRRQAMFPVEKNQRKRHR